MDIAEIRKKAKSKESLPEHKPDTAEETVVEDAPSVETTTDEVDVTTEDAGTEMVVTSDQPSRSPHDSSDGLERLIAATDELALATDESYAEFLEDASASQAQNISQYLAFHLGDEEYALDIKKISEIIKVREFTDIPRAPEYVLGIISLRGVVVPVFDLRVRLNLGRSELLTTSRIVVCQIEDLTVGLLVDSINQVVNLVDDDIEPPPGVLSGLDREMVFGIGRYQGRMIILLQINSVLDAELS
jgi:purine-binding chemotaxis protein CheW